MFGHKKETIEIPHDVKDRIGELTRDGILSREDSAEIAAYIQDHYKENPLDADQLDAAADFALENAVKSFSKKVPQPLKILGGLVALNSALAVFPLIEAVRELLELFEEGLLADFATTTLILALLALVLSLAYMVLSVFMGVRLLRDRRAYAARIVRAMAAVLVVLAVVVLMLSGVSTAVFALTGVLVVLVVFESYLNVSLRNELDLRYRFLMVETENRAETGKLGLELKGPGYAEIDFVNLFWIFFIGCFAGIIVETVFTMVVTHPGVYENRTGVLFGPFSPIYGFGAVLVTLALNRIQKKNIILVFILATIMCGSFEYFVSWFMEVGFGAKAWDYHGRFLGDLLNGRTCLAYASMFGFLATVYLKFLLPGIIKLINLIPWNLRYVVTAAFAAVMLVNCLMTVQALDCWFSRVSGNEPATAGERFYAEHFDDDWMQDHFQTIHITPETAARDE